MVEIHLLLKDGEYQRRLAKALANLNEKRQIYLHDEMEDFREQQQKERNSKELWMVSEEYCQMIPEGKRKLLVMTAYPVEKKGYCFLYQSISCIQQKIVEILYDEGLAERNSQWSAPKFWYLYSPFGGIGVSGIAYEIAKKLSKKERVLLLSFDSFHNFVLDFIPFRLSDYLFYRQTLGEANIEDFCIRKEGFDILHGPTQPRDLEVLKREEKRSFLRSLQFGKYDRVIFDLSSSNMLDWCLPQEENESLFVIRKEEEKWKRFAVTAEFEYTAIEAEHAVRQLTEHAEREKDVDEILSPNYRRS